MPMKRPLSPCERDDKSAKRRAIEPVIDYDDDLEAVLAQIKQQEESEALARKLQEEWNNEPNLVEDETTDVILENDEALARRLAFEWDREDNTLAENAVSGTLSAVQPTESHGQPFADFKQKNKAPPSDETPDIVLKRYRSFFVGARHCTNCGHDIPSPRGFVSYSDQMPPPSLISLMHIHCSNCQTNYCRGCFRLLPCSTSCKGRDNDPACPVWTCCAEVRAIALFEALGGFDRHYLGERATSASRSKEATDKYRQSGSGSIGPGGTGYGMGQSGSYGSAYGGNVRASRGRGGARGGRGGRGFVEPPPSRPLVEQAIHPDVIIVKALQTITQLLPAPYCDSPHDYDLLPHATTATLILASYLPELLGSLLRNDSVTDWTSRSEVYHAMLGLLRRMSDCELTLEVIIGRRYDLEKSGGLAEWMWGDAELSWVESKEGKLVLANPLYAHFQKLTKQCEMFLSGASQMLESGEEPSEEDESIIKSTSLCGEIIAARDDLERAMKVISRAPMETVLPSVQLLDQTPSTSSHGTKSLHKGKAGALSNQQVEKLYASECERLAFHHVPFPQENGNFTTFKFADLVSSSAKSTRNPKDRLHLIKELAVTATSLPPGVWVRVDEVRNDVLKIMIAGPEGTPYFGGLFEFDCFLPLEYPHKPPMMHLRTTGGGSVRFNPNLYNNGKVCLSLLGTWPGRPEEQWSSKSTLLQVLVSIQSMILVDLPYFNEPGRGQAKRNIPSSIAYNKDIAVQTVRWAMIEWFSDTHRESMWADVIKTHFTLLAPKILSSIQEWAREDLNMTNYTSTSMHNPNVYGMGPIPPTAYKSNSIPAGPAGNIPTPQLLLPSTPSTSTSKVSRVDHTPPTAHTDDFHTGLMGLEYLNPQSSSSRVPRTSTHNPEPEMGNTPPNHNVDSVHKILADPKYLLHQLSSPPMSSTPGAVNAPLKHPQDLLSAAMVAKLMGTEQLLNPRSSSSRTSSSSAHNNNAGPETMYSRNNTHDIHPGLIDLLRQPSSPRMSSTPGAGNAPLKHPQDFLSAAIVAKLMGTEQLLNPRSSSPRTSSSSAHNNAGPGTVYSRSNTHDIHPGLIDPKHLLRQSSSPRMSSTPGARNTPLKHPQDPLSAAMVAKLMGTEQLLNSRSSSSRTSSSSSHNNAGHGTAYSRSNTHDIHPALIDPRHLLGQPSSPRMPSASTSNTPGTGNMSQAPQYPPPPLSPEIYASLMAPQSSLSSTSTPSTHSVGPGTLYTRNPSNTLIVHPTPFDPSPIWSPQSYASSQSIPNTNQSGLGFPPPSQPSTYTTTANDSIAGNVNSISQAMLSGLGGSKGGSLVGGDGSSRNGPGRGKVMNESGKVQGRGGMNLVEEFQKGLKRVEQWDVSGNGRTHDSTSV